jgi:signal peptidase I
VLDAGAPAPHSAGMTDTPMPEASAAPQVAPPVKKEESLTRFVVKMLLFVLILRSFVISQFVIPSESMLPRLLVGDYLVVSKWSYGYSKHALPYSLPIIPGRIFASTPERGDVAVFKAPPGNSVDYIKRVIGLPGDTIQVQGGQLILNGKPVPKVRAEDKVIPVSANTQCTSPDFAERASDGALRCRYPQFKETLPNGKSYLVLDLIDSTEPREGGVITDYTQIYTVPAGHLFMMGDNRDFSADSRFPAIEGGGIGFVPMSNLVGKAQFSYFSTDGSAEWIKPWTWFSAARGDRIGEGF